MTAFTAEVQLRVTNLGTKVAKRLCEGDLVVTGNSVATVKGVEYVEGTRQRLEVTLSFYLGDSHLVDQVQTVSRDHEYHLFGVVGVTE